MKESIFFSSTKKNSIFLCFYLIFSLFISSSFKYRNTRREKKLEWSITRTCRFEIIQSFFPFKKRRKKIVRYKNYFSSWKDTQDPAACNTNPDVYMKYSRDPERTPFQWDDTKNAGFSTADKTWLPVHPNYVELNVKAQKEAEKSHLKFYQELMNLRRHPTFQDGTLKLQALNRNVLAYVRELRNSDTFVVVINFGPNAELVNLNPFKTLRDKLKVVAAAPSSDYHEG